MPDWKPTRYRKTAVVFEEQTYFVASRTPLPGGIFRYVLQPWPEDLHDSPGRTIYYDEAYVVERDETRLEQGKLERKAVGLSAAAWLLGFLPSGIKLRLNERYAIHPVTVTRQSLFIEYLALICLGAFLVIFVVGGALAPAFGAAPQAVLSGVLRPLRLLLAAGLLALDVTIRSNRVERGGMRQYGFGEWIFRRLRDEG